MAASSSPGLGQHSSAALSSCSALKVHINHGSDRYEVFVSEAEQTDDFTLGEFAQRIEATTGVPVENQRLIFKGKSYVDLSTPFRSIGLTNNCKVMLLGQKFHVDDAGHVSTMQSVETSVGATEKKLSDLAKQLSDIQRGFLAADLREEGLVKLGRHVAACIESLTAQLERLDALTLSRSATDIQNKRKAIVRRIQEALNTADALHAQSTDTLNRITD